MTEVTIDAGSRATGRNGRPSVGSDRRSDRTADRRRTGHVPVANPPLTAAACSALLVLDFLGEVHSQNKELIAELTALGYVEVDGMLMAITPSGRKRASGFRRLASGVVTETTEAGLAEPVAHP